jgi:hypothetical protein
VRSMAAVNSVRLQKLLSPTTSEHFLSGASLVHRAAQTAEQLDGPFPTAVFRVQETNCDGWQPRPEQRPGCQHISGMLATNDVTPNVTVSHSHHDHQCRKGKSSRTPCDG